jgi:hypothetical protein
MSIYQPFTYKLAWTDLGVYYYGVRYAQGCTPADLWTTYFTSSQVVAELRETYGDPDVIEIRRVFEDSDSAIDWEHKVLRRLKVMEKDNWLNRGIGKAPRFHESHREALKLAAKNRKYTPAGYAALSARTKKLWADSDFRKTRIDQITKGMTPEGKARIAEFQRGRTRTDEHKQLISDMRKAEWSDDEKTAARKKAISDAIKAKWADPEYRAKMMSRRKTKK